MDKENGKNKCGNNNKSGTSAEKTVDSHNLHQQQSLFDQAGLFGAYWPRDAGGTGNLFAAAAAGGGFSLPPHHPAAASSMSYGILPPAAPTTPTVTSCRSTSSYTAAASPSTTAAAAAVAYSNAYTNTLSVAASQAASLGIPAASAAWWSMASHLAAQDYLARLQASGLNFPSHTSVDQWMLPTSTHLGTSNKNKNRHSASTRSTNKQTIHELATETKSTGNNKYSALQQQMRSNSANSDNNDDSGRKVSVKNCTSESGGVQVASSSSPSIFTSPLSLANSSVGSVTQSDGADISTSNNSILGESGGLLGGVRLPPDTEIIKYTSSIVGPKIPGTTNRGRKKTISLDPPSISLHPSLASHMIIEQQPMVKRPRLEHESSASPPPSTMDDRVEVIKLPNSAAAINGGSNESCGDAPLNLSLKTGSSTGANSSLDSLSSLSANIGMDRISRRKPGPKPRRLMVSQPPPGAPSASLAQLFASADSPRPPSRSNENNSDGGSSTSSTSTPAAASSSALSSSANHKEGRPRNLGRGVSKPKKNTVASLLAQSRALGIKPMPILEAMNNAALSQHNHHQHQQMNLLRSNLLAAHQQYLISDGAGSEENRMLNKCLQANDNKYNSKCSAMALSDSSTVDASTDSDHFTDSNHTDSEMELENAAMPTTTSNAALAAAAAAAAINAGISSKKHKQYDERALRVPLDKGWKRETVIRGLTKSGGIKGDVIYMAPDSANKFKQMSDITQYLEYQKNSDLSKENFTFSCRVILGDYLQPVPPELIPEGGEYIHLTEEEVIRRLDEIKSTMRTTLPVEQRIEMARKQQAARAAARMDREHARLAKELERSERQEAARRDREARSQQMLEAKRKRQEEMEKQRVEEQQRKQQEREFKRQQAAILKEQERERRRQHMALVKALENRRKLEERERKKQQLLAEKQANKEKKLEQRKMELEILNELRKPCEDLELDQKPLPDYERIPGLKLPGKAFADVLMVFEFLHNFGETLGFDMESLPTLDSLQQALMPNENSSEAEEELFSVMTHLLVCAIEDPGIPNPARHTTILGQSLRQADITHANLSEILRIYLYANATGEVKALSGVHFERDREKRVADHHQNDNEMQQTSVGKNSQYYELLHENDTWKMSDMLKDKPFMALSPTAKAEILAFICNELLQNKAVIRQIENSLENVAHQRKEKWLLDTKLRKIKMIHSRKVRSEAVEKAQKSNDEDTAAMDSPSHHQSQPKEDLIDDDENEISDGEESVCTQPEEEEDNKLGSEELGKKVERLVRASELQLQALNTSANQLRATCFGQDRFWRRYWSLSKGGGVFVESMESAEPELVNQLDDQEEMKQEPCEEPAENGEITTDEEKPFTLFDKLGKSCEDPPIECEVRAEIKEEFKSEILNELKAEIKAETDDTKWFSLQQRDGIQCEGVHMTTGTGAACTRDNLTELKIPVFPPPSSCTTHSNTTSYSCDSPAPLQMTQEESVQLEQIKKYGMPKSCRRQNVPKDLRRGWWRINDVDQLKSALEAMHARGARERELKRNFIHVMQTVYEQTQGGVCIEPGQDTLTELSTEGMDSVKMNESGTPEPDEIGAWSEKIAHRVDMFLLEQVEALEDKVASASMQIKGWKLPSRDSSDVPPDQVVPMVRERLASLELNIERRYLKPPLGNKPSCINIASNNSACSTTATTSTEVNNSATECQESALNSSSSANTSTCSEQNSDVPKGLTVWREAVQRSQTSAQLAMCLYSLESSIAWDKSIMKANCQFCHSGDNEDKLLLCDGCDKGYHTYCFRPKMDNIPEGDWYCHECMNKATGERNCIVCGKKCSQSGTRLILCELCPRSYHTECMNPPMNKVPRGKWYCTRCITKKPQKKPTVVKKNNVKSNRDSELSDHPPCSPAPSHSSVTTNEDITTTNCNQSDISNSSLAGSPGSTPKKERISKKLLKELAPCKTLMEDLECHDDAWPFLLPVNTKQFPTYKKIIKTPMDLSTIKKKLSDMSYKSKEEFYTDVRQIFHNCEVFNEDDSPVGKAGHCMRQYFETRWNELCTSNLNS